MQLINKLKLAIPQNYIGPITYPITVTPEIAKELLKHNIKNRLLGEKTVELYAKQMRAGNWKGVDTIKISVNGRLLDGQHRLTAVVKANVTVTMLVTFNCDEDIICDRGRIRGKEDELYLAGLIEQKLNKNELSCVDAYIAANKGILLKNSNRITLDEEAAFINKYESYVYGLGRMLGNGTSHGIAFNSCTGAAVLGALINGIPSSTVWAFCKAVNTGIYDAGETASAVLRNYLQESSHKSKEEGMMLAECCIYKFYKKENIQRKPNKLKHLFLISTK